MEWNIIIGIICTVLGAAVGYATFSRNKEKDNRSEGKQTGVILTEIGYIKSSIDTANQKLDRQEERNIEFMSRLASVEASAKSAHRRIDRLEGREDHETH